MLQGGERLRLTRKTTEELTTSERRSTKRNEAQHSVRSSHSIGRVWQLLM
eukprot:SAG31_NODE_1773_length_7304_cov_2.180380_2_plen_50_part_00